MSNPRAFPPEADAELSAPAPSPALIAVERAISDLRRGGMVVLRDAERRAAIVAQAAEMTTAEGLRTLQKLTGSQPTVAVTRNRVAALRPSAAAASVQSLIPPTGSDVAWLRRFVDPTFRGGGEPDAGEGFERLSAIPEREGGLAHTAVRLAKYARLLPAALFARASAPEVERIAGWSRDMGLILVESAHVLAFPALRARRLTRAAEAEVPLADAEKARLVAFRPLDGGEEHVAIVVGEPDFSRPAPVRLHSQCLTGDLLGSLRCDCGEQLRGAIRILAAEGGGVLVYLAQEGRDIGLVNKLRAYELQDLGVDTVDANEQLGFEADERVYAPAAEILRQLGVRAVRLLTNNPDKMAQLAAAGVEVTGRIAHVFPPNRHNERYLRAKADRAGHLF